MAERVSLGHQNVVRIVMTNVLLAQIDPLFWDRLSLLGSYKGQDSQKPLLRDDTSLRRKQNQ